MARRSFNFLSPEELTELTRLVCLLKILTKEIARIMLSKHEDKLLTCVSLSIHLSKRESQTWCFSIFDNECGAITEKPKCPSYFTIHSGWMALSNLVRCGELESPIIKYFQPTLNPFHFEMPEGLPYESIGKLVLNMLGTSLVGDPSLVLTAITMDRDALTEFWKDKPNVICIIMQFEQTSK